MIALHTVGALVLAAGEDESLKPGLKSSDVAPGTIGFIMTLILAVLVVLLALDHTRRQRRLAARFDYAMAREAEEREAREASASDPIVAGNPGQDAEAPTGSVPGDAEPAGGRESTEGRDRRRRS